MAERLGLTGYQSNYEDSDLNEMDDILGVGGYKSETDEAIRKRRETQFGVNGDVEIESAIAKLTNLLRYENESESDASDEESSPLFTTTYAGQPSRAYLKLRSQQEQSKGDDGNRSYEMLLDAMDRFQTSGSSSTSNTDTMQSSTNLNEQQQQQQQQNPLQQQQQLTQQPQRQQLREANVVVSSETQQALPSFELDVSTEIKNKTADLLQSKDFRRNEALLHSFGEWDTSQSTTLSESQISDMLQRVMRPYDKRERKILNILQKKEEEFASLPFTPNISEKSRKLAAGLGSIIERTDTIRNDSKRRLDELREAKEKSELEELKKPKINSSSRRMKRNLASFEEWVRERDRKIKQQQESMKESELRGCSFEPKLSNRSVKIYKKKFKNDNVFERNYMFEFKKMERIQQKIQESIAIAAAEQSPMITDKAASLERTEPVGDRLYKMAMESLSRKQMRRAETWDTHWNGSTHSNSTDSGSAYMADASSCMMDNAHESDMQPNFNAEGLYPIPPIFMQNDDEFDDSIHDDYAISGYYASQRGGRSKSLPRGSTSKSAPASQQHSLQQQQQQQVDSPPRSRSKSLSKTSRALTPTPGSQVHRRSSTHRESIHSRRRSSAKGDMESLAAFVRNKVEQHNRLHRVHSPLSYNSIMNRLQMNSNSPAQQYHQAYHARQAARMNIVNSLQHNKYGTVEDTANGDGDAQREVVAAYDGDDDDETELNLDDVRKLLKSQQKRRTSHSTATASGSEVSRSMPEGSIRRTSKSVPNVLRGLGALELYCSD